MNMHPVPRHSHSRLTNPEVLEAFEFAAQADAPNTQAPIWRTGSTFSPGARTGIAARFL